MDSGTDRTNLAILVGGGPAPGINSVIAAATIRARLEGLDVVGIRDGFQWIMQGDIDSRACRSTSSRSAGRTSAAGRFSAPRAPIPTKNPKLLENA